MQRFSSVLRSSGARLFSAAAARRTLSSSSSTASQAKFSVRKIALWGGAATLIGGGLALFGISTVEAKEAPANLTAGQEHEVTLYQYQVCPFCNKVRAMLDYAKTPYTVVEVNPLTKKEIKFSEYKKVPIVLIDGRQLQDSSDVMRAIRDDLKLPAPLSAAEKMEEDFWLDWVDTHFVHLLSPNIYRTPRETKQAFDYLFQSCGEWSYIETVAAQYVGSAVMYLIGKKLKSKHGIDDERKALYDACENWMKAVGNRDMMGGANPNLADLAVFGVLRAISGMDTFRDVSAHTGIMPWYNKVAAAVGPSRQINLKKKKDE